MNMGLQQPIGGLAFVCDLDGTIYRVIRDEIGLKLQDMVGSPLPLFVDRSSLGKSLNFLMEMKGQGAAFDWELAIPSRGGIVVLSFSGASTKESLFIVAARTSSEVKRLLEELIKIGSEQVNTLRIAMKDRADLLLRGAHRDSTVFDRLARLNNEFANLQRELSKKNAELERLNEQKNHFLGIAAHDLRNPLNAIQMYSEFLLEEASNALNEEQTEFLSIIQSSSEFMLRLVNDLLDVAKIESGKLQLDLVVTDLVPFIEHNVVMNRPLAARKNIEIRFVNNGESISILIDRAKLEQVLNNLITNAVKFSPPSAMVEVVLERLGNKALISVIDRGPGIPAQELHNLFKPFQRTSVKPSAGEQSTGLGLAIARKIVLGHGGDIWVESQVGKGSTFCVSLQLSES